MHNFKDNPEAMRVLGAVKSGENLFVTGEGGSGKSALLREFCTEVEKLPGKGGVVVVAPTGLAALKVGGQTIHSFFGLGPHRFAPEDFAEVSPTDWVQRKLQNLRVLIIDEISMVRADLFSLLEYLLREYGPMPGQPWGGVQVLCFGDFLQLPPVVSPEDAVLFDGQSREHGGWASPYAFATEAWKAGEFTQVTLLRNYRQAGDAPWRALLSRLRRGELDAGDEAALRARVGVADTPEWRDALRLCPRRDQADTRNTEALARIPGETSRIKASLKKANAKGVLAPVAESELDDNRLPVPPMLELKLGARVMLCRNLTESGRMNGEVGVVADLVRSGAEVTAVKVLFDGAKEPVAVLPETWTEWKFEWKRERKCWEKSVAREYRQVPLRLAWALTIHKAQGQTIGGRMVVTAGCFAPSQLYVALSRTTLAGNLRLEKPPKARELAVDPRAAAFMSGLSA